MLCTPISCSIKLKYCTIPTVDTYVIVFQVDYLKMRLSIIQSNGAICISSLNYVTFMNMTF